MTTRYKIPQISPASSVVEFTTNHAALYPFFMRLVPQVALQSQQMAHLFVNFFNWKKIGILFASDPLGTGGATALVQEAVKVGLNVLVQASFNLGDTDHTFQIGRIVDSEARIIVFWGLSSDLQRIFRSIQAGYAAGRNPNLLGDGYQWFLCHGAVNVASVERRTRRWAPPLQCILTLCVLGCLFLQSVQRCLGQVDPRPRVEHARPDGHELLYQPHLV